MYELVRVAALRQFEKFDHLIFVINVHKVRSFRFNKNHGWDCSSTTREISITLTSIRFAIFYMSCNTQQNTVVTKVVSIMINSGKQLY